MSVAPLTMSVEEMAMSEAENVDGPGAPPPDSDSSNAGANQASPAQEENLVRVSVPAERLTKEEFIRAIEEFARAQLAKKAQASDETKPQ